MLRHFLHIFGSLLIIGMIAGWGLIDPGVARETSPVPVEVSTVAVPEFPTGITFSAEIPVEPDLGASGASLLYRIAGDETLNLAVVQSHSMEFGDDSISVTVFVDLQTAFVPMGVELLFFWELLSGHDVVLETEEESTEWIDTRFQWNKISTDQVTLHSYGISPSFAVDMLNESQRAMTNLEKTYSLDPLEPIVIWVYPEYGTFFETMPANTRESIAGVSFPGSAVVAAVVPDGNEREFGRVILHEISHQVLYQATENPFAYPPIWFDEGIATHTQTGGTDHYASMVYRAWSEGTLFDITSLNATFPFQPAQATLAYASSWSMLSYLQERYGDEGTARMIEAFGEGLATEEAIQVALGVSATELNDAWQQWVGDNPV